MILTGAASHVDECEFAFGVSMMVGDRVSGWRAVLVEEDGSWEAAFPYLPLPGENTALAMAFDEYNTSKAEVQFSMSLLYVMSLMRPGPPVLEGEIVQLYAQTFGGAGQTEYKYEVNDGTGWILIRDYQVEPDRIIFPLNPGHPRIGDDEPHCTWTAGPPGEYTIRVTARDHGTTEPEVSAEGIYTVVGPLSGVSLSADPTSPQPTGVQILLTAAPIGGVMSSLLCRIGKRTPCFPEFVLSR